MEKYVYVDGKKYRRGYTTGTCAAVSAVAAVKSLFTKKTMKNVKIKVPSGDVLDIEVESSEMSKEEIAGGILKKAAATVRKDGGDDIDATNGMLISAAAEIVPVSEIDSSVMYFYSDEKIAITSGKGIGVCTRKGLKCEIGKPAINETPRSMIVEGVSELLGEIIVADSISADDFLEKNGFCVKITVSAPEGEEIAKQTFNSRLGIIGGISIIGSSGIVEPMSDEGWKKTLSLELEMVKRKGYDYVVFAPGNHGISFLKENYDIEDEVIVKISNFIGYMLMEAVRLGIKNIIMAGHIGKFVKLAGGIFNTHSRVADARNDILIANLAMMKAPYELLEKVYDSKSTDESVEYVLDYGYGELYNILAEKCVKRAKQHMRINDVNIGTVLFSLDGKTLGKSMGFDELVNNCFK